MFSRYVLNLSIFAYEYAHFDEIIPLRSEILYIQWATFWKAVLNNRGLNMYFRLLIIENLLPRYHTAERNWQWQIGSSLRSIQVLW